MAELLNESRERLFKQFSSADESNPLADLPARAPCAAIRQSSDQQHTHLREMNERISALQVELTKLQAEKEKAIEVAAEHDRSTAKGRPYEEAVFEALDAIAHGQGDDCDAVGDLPGVGGRKGDVLVGIDGCAGPAARADRVRGQELAGAEGRALDELDEAMAQRDADYGVWVVPSEAQLPARTQPMREFNGDKLFVVFDPEEDRLALQVAYSLARARVLMAKGDSTAWTPRAARRGRAGARRARGRPPDPPAAHARRQRRRGRARDPGRDGAPREGAPAADRRAAHRRGGVTQRRLAELALGLGVNLQPGQTLRVSAEIGQAPMVRTVAEAAYARGARFVDVSWFDPHVQAARVRHAPEDALGEVPPWEVERVRRLGADGGASIKITGPTAAARVRRRGPGPARAHEPALDPGVARGRARRELDRHRLPDARVGRVAAPGRPGRARGAVERRRVRLPARRAGPRRRVARAPRPAAPPRDRARTGSRWTASGCTAAGPTSRSACSPACAGSTP